MIPVYIVWVMWLPVVGVLTLLQVRRRRPAVKVFGVAVLVTYAFWIASVAFFPMPAVAEGAGSAWDVARESVNFVPLRLAINALGDLPAGQIVREYGGNLLLFTPFTLVMPALWRSLRSWGWVLLIGAGGSLFVELCQLGFSILVRNAYRRSDIDDVLINTVGACLGYAILRLGLRVNARRRRTTRTG